MLPRHLVGLVVSGLLAGCGPGQRYASAEPTYLRFELMADAHPESVARWYECFALEDAEYRELCLSRTAGVRVSQGPGLVCDRAAPPSLCRAFPLYAPEQYESSTVDDDNAGAAIADAFGRLLVAILTAALDSDDDPAERDSAETAGDRAKEQTSRRSAGSERHDPKRERRARQPDCRSLKRR